MKTIQVGNLTIDGSRLFLIAGPCVIEGYDRTLMIGREVKRICEKLGVQYIFKASFDKANRSSYHSFRGPGLEEGLRILKSIKKELDVPVLSDVHDVTQLEKASEVLDMLQIPAFLCRQTDLVYGAAMTGKPVNVKKGQFMAPEDMRNVLDKMEEAHNPNLAVTERGVSFGYHNLVVDMRSFPMMRKFGYPVIYDATHSVQLPGAMTTISPLMVGRTPEFLGHKVEAREMKIATMVVLMHPFLILVGTGISAAVAAANPEIESRPN